MTAIQFFQFKSKDIANRCIVIVERRTISIVSLWGPGQLDYRPATNAEFVAIIQALEKAGAVVQMLAREAAR